MPELISIAEAASRLGGKPWDVVRLIDAGALRVAVLVDADSLTEHQQQESE